MVNYHSDYKHTLIQIMLICAKTENLDKKTSSTICSTKIENCFNIFCGLYTFKAKFLLGFLP